MTIDDLTFAAVCTAAILLSLLWASRRLTEHIRQASLRMQSAYERRADRLEKDLQGRLNGLEIQTHADLQEVNVGLERVLKEIKNSEKASDESMRHALSDRLSQLEKHLTEQVRQSVLLSSREHQTEQRLRMDRVQNDLGFIKNRVSAYLGGGTGLTWLVDETPIYLNTDDFGCPSNFLNGGRYEEEYLQVLASFRKPDSVFLDIGANLGVFSLRLAPLMRQGHVHAFEPNPRIHDLFSRSIHLNGYKHLIQVHRVGVSDQDADMVLAVPDGHAGGGHVVETTANYSGPSISVRRIDDLLSHISRFDLAKIDVEGHELHALRGMSELLGRSPDAVILFEKLNAHSGIEADLLAFFQAFGMVIHRIDGVHLAPVDQAAFEQAEAYFLAARPATIGRDHHRNFIELFPADLHAIRCQSTVQCLSVGEPLPAESVVFHGPYWYLPRGSYRMSIDGDVQEAFKLVLAEKFGYAVAEFVVHDGQKEFDFVVPNDLTQFELVGRSMGDRAMFELRRIRLTRLG
jgi:FkbM family methyltransferase